MLALKRTIPLICALALLVAASIVPAASAAAVAPSLAAKKGKAKKKCPKGFKTKTVKRHGKKTRKCVKKAAHPTPGPTPQKGLFEAPGRKLENDEAKSYVAKYLPNSTFTDCPSGWPNCPVEQRYSHDVPNVFYYCRLTNTSGADIRVTDEWGLEGAIVEPDGSWTVRERVYDHGYYPVYEWHVAANGVVNGAYSFPGNSIEQIGPLQYIPGAKDCSY